MTGTIRTDGGRRRTHERTSADRSATERLGNDRTSASAATNTRVAGGVRGKGKLREEQAAPVTTPTATPKTDTPPSRPDHAVRENQQKAPEAPPSQRTSRRTKDTGKPAPAAAPARPIPAAATAATAATAAPKPDPEPQTPEHTDDDTSDRATRRARRLPVADAGLEPGAAPSRGERVGDSLRVWRGELAQTGGPNALLWYKDNQYGTLDLTKAHPTGASMLMTGNTVKLSHLVREDAAFREALTIARRIRAKARELREEHGITACYVCIGMSTWELPGTQRRPQAPVLIRAVRLHAVDAAETDVELQLSSRVEINPVFLHYMASEQGIRLDGDALADLARSAGRFDPLPVYRELRRLLLHVPDFTITDRRIVSTFATSKMSMVADLAAFAGLLGGNDIIAALAGDPAAGQMLRNDGDAGLADSDRHPAEADLSREAAVLDADPTQADAIDTARSGHHVLIDAPRGCGLTQTLANTAAALVGNDRRVLVISENSRQLGDLITHLDRAELADLVLDARDLDRLRRTLPATMLARIDGDDDEYDFRTAYDRETRTLREQRTTQETPADDDPEQALAASRARLLSHVDSLHATRPPWDVSVFEAQTALARLSERETPPTSRVRIPPEAVRALTREKLAQAIATTTELAREGAWTTTPGDDDPWWGARLHRPEDIRRALYLVMELSGGRLATDRLALDVTFADVGLPPAYTARDWAETLDLINRVRGTLGSFRPEIFRRPLAPLVAATAPATESRSHWWSRSQGKRDARALVLPYARLDSLYDGLRRACEQKAHWSRLTGDDSEPRVPAGFDEASTRWNALAADLALLDEALADTNEGSRFLDLPLDVVQERLDTLARRADRNEILPQVTERIQALTADGLGDILNDLARRHIPAENVAAEIEFIWWLSILDLVAEEDTAYGAHDGAALHNLVDDYAQADRAMHTHRSRRVLDRARAHARVEASTRPDQVDILRRAAAPDAPHRLPRALLAEAGELVAAIAPIWVMSPLTLASVVPTHLTFDAVIIDDAARMPVAHAVSALARGSRVIAGGDLAGLGPRPFETVAGPLDLPEPDGTAETSVLEALAEHLPVRRLSRMYTDRDPRIATFATARRQTNVEIWPVAGQGPCHRLLRTGAVISSVDQAGEALARENAKVVEVLFEHARARPESSLAAIAVTTAQAVELDRAIREGLAADPKLAAAAAFSEGAAEQFLVATVDQAAGCSRDTVVFASGLEPLPGMELRAPGRLHRADGDRVIDAVAMIARRRLDVVTAFTCADLSRIEASSPGQRRLAELLVHVEGQESADKATDPERHALMGELAIRLRHEGLVVHEGYGEGGPRLDLVVEDPYVPGRLAVAVISDGARHAAVPTVRERERLLPDLLDAGGWRCVRVWSTDVFRDPARDVSRIVEMVRASGDRRR